MTILLHITMVLVLGFGGFILGAYIHDFLSGRPIRYCRTCWEKHRRSFDLRGISGVLAHIWQYHILRKSF